MTVPGGELPGGAPASVAVLLLTGGASRRMGVDKARMRVGGQPAAVRLAELARLVAVGPALEVGLGVSGLAWVREGVPGAGPLVATAAGAHHVRARLGWRGPALVLACDLPLVSLGALRALAQWPTSGSVVPTWEGQPQPLCARWSAEDLDLAGKLARAGERALGTWVAQAHPTLLEPWQWPYADELADADTPEQWRALGLDG